MIYNSTLTAKTESINKHQLFLCTNKECSRKRKCKKKKTFKKAKWLSEKAFQIAVKRREGKGKGEMERYTHLNAEFQRIEAEIRKPSSVISAKK